MGKHSDQNYLAQYLSAISIEERQRILEESYRNQLMGSALTAREKAAYHLDNLAGYAMTLTGVVILCGGEVTQKTLKHLDILICISICSKCLHELLPELQPGDMPDTCKEALVLLCALLDRLSNCNDSHSFSVSIHLLSAICILLQSLICNQVINTETLPQEQVILLQSLPLPLFGLNQSMNDNLSDAILNLRAELQALPKCEGEG